MSKLRTCLLCKEQYKYCNTCHEDRNKPAFMVSFCSENCKDIFETLSRFGVGHISKEECRNLLNTYDLSKKANYTETTLKTISMVTEEEKPASIIEESVVEEAPVLVINEEPVVEEAPIAEEEPVVEEAKPITASPQYNFYRKSKKKHEVVEENN